MAVGSAALEQGRDLHDRPRYMTQQALQPSQMPSQPVSSTELSFIASSAGQQGAMAAAASGALSGALVYALTAFSPRFRALTPSASIKTALVVSPMFAAFFYKSHLVIGKVLLLSPASASPALREDVCTRRRRGTRGHFSPRRLPRRSEWCNNISPPGRPPQTLSTSTLSRPSSGESSVVGLPTRAWSVHAAALSHRGAGSHAASERRVAGPLYGAIFFKESTHPSTANMILSQRLIHTRVYGQASLARSS